MEGLVRLCRLHRDVPARFGRGPVGRSDPVVEVNVSADAGFGGRVLYVLEDRVAVGNRLLHRPGPKRVTEGVHVRVGADARIAEQIPCSANGVSSLEDGVAGPGTLRLEIVAGTDARQPGTNDQDVEVRRLRVRELRHQVGPICLS